MPRGIPNAKPDVEAESVEAEPVETPREPEVTPEPVEVEALPERREVFEATRPDGTVVVVDRNIDTGEQTVTDK